MATLPPAGRRVLHGKRILVTRAAHQASKLSNALREHGAEPVEVPVLEIRPPESFVALDAALCDLCQYDWLIFTSANSVRSVAARAKELGRPFGVQSISHVAAVGAATAAAVEQLGLKVNLVPESYVAESLVATLAPQLTGKRVLLARAAIARDVIPDALRAAGATVDVMDAYRNVLPVSAPERLRAAVVSPIDAATFTSSSAVTHLEEAARLAGVAFPLVGVPAISIGPITSQTLRGCGWEPAAEANVSDISGLIAAVERVFEA